MENSEDNNRTWDAAIAYTADRIGSVNDPMLDERRRTFEVTVGVTQAVSRTDIVQVGLGLLAEMGGVALSVALSSKPSETSDLFLLAYGVGTTVGVLLPYSRMHETEADHLGLVFMAMAGYDPRVATDFWRRMAESKKGASVPEFLSTHPADSKRIKTLEKLMPEAMKYYREK